MKKPRKNLPGLGSPPERYRPAAVRLRPPRQASLPAESAFRRRPLLCLAFGAKCHVVNHCFTFRGCLSLVVVTRMYPCYRQIDERSTVFQNYFGKLSKSFRECKNPAHGGLWWANGGLWWAHGGLWWARGGHEKTPGLPGLCKSNRAASAASLCSLTPICREVYGVITSIFVVSM